MSYIERMIIDYKGDPVDIIKEISLNLKRNERYFALFITGATFAPVFLGMNIEDRATFITNMTNVLKFSDERVLLTTEYISDKIRIQSRKYPYNRYNERYNVQ